MRLCVAGKERERERERVERIDIIEREMPAAVADKPARLMKGQDLVGDSKGKREQTRASPNLDRRHRANAVDRR